MIDPKWFHDGQMGLLRRLLRTAYAHLDQAEGAAPPGPVTPEVAQARIIVWAAEQALALRIIELQAEDAASRRT